MSLSLLAASWEGEPEDFAKEKSFYEFVEKEGL